MIELINVTKWFPTDFGRHYVLRNVNLKLAFDRNVGIIGPNGSGKSTLLRVMAGADTPNEGKVIRTGLISPPMGLTPSLLGALTGGENARFACRVYGMERDEMEDVVEEVESLARIGKYFDMPVGTYSAGMKQRVAFAISMSLHYDYYLFDEIGAGGDREFNDMVQERLATSKFVMTSHRMDEIVSLCQACIVLKDGELRYFDDIQDGMAFYGESYDLTEVHRKIERKSKRKEVQSQIDSGALPASREERKAVIKEQRKQQKVAAPADGAAAEEAAKAKKTKDPEARKQRRKAKKAEGAETAAPGAEASSQEAEAARGGAAAVPRLLARPGIPMAPRIRPQLPPPAADAHSRLALLRERLSQRTVAEDAGPILLPRSEPEASRPAETGPVSAADGADEDTPFGTAEAGPTSHSDIVRAQDQAALRAARAWRLLQRLLDEPVDEEPGSREKTASQAAAAQRAAADASSKALRLLDGHQAEGAGPSAELSSITAGTVREARSQRKQSRRQRRSSPDMAQETQP